MPDDNLNQAGEKWNDSQKSVNWNEFRLNVKSHSGKTEMTKSESELENYRC